MTNPEIDRFWDKVDKMGPVNPVTGIRCWNWIGARTRGYGQMRFCGGIYLAHRISMHLSKGTPLSNNGNKKTGLVLHKCNNSLCVNPDHLYIGTQEDNVGDSTNLGNRFIRRSKYSTTDVNAMKFLRLSGYTLSSIAEVYGCTKQNIHYLLAGNPTI